MTDASTSLHEPVERLTPETLETRRGLVSLLEELEAIDWYDQRIDAAEDPELQTLLAHNRDEEKEHAMMALEWLRRRDSTLDAQMRAYLFTAGDIAGADTETTGETQSQPNDAVVVDDSLGVGSLREEV